MTRASILDSPQPLDQNLPALQAYILDGQECIQLPGEISTPKPTTDFQLDVGALTSIIPACLQPLPQHPSR